jgi:hypothetical protein
MTEQLERQRTLERSQVRCFLPARRCGDLVPRGVLIDIVEGAYPAMFERGDVEGSSSVRSNDTLASPFGSTPRIGGTR